MYVDFAAGQSRPCTASGRAASNSIFQLENVVARILRERAIVSDQHCLLVGISGIDGSGKGYVAEQIRAQLGQHSIASANISVDGWLNLPGKRFSAVNAAENFYKNAIRFDELFPTLLLPLKNHRSVSVTADFITETASAFRKEVHRFENVDVVLVEGIFLFKREYRNLFDLAIWIDCSFPTALARAVARGQEGLPPRETIRAYKAIYFPAQEIHFTRDSPRETADLVVNNDLSLAQFDPSTLRR
jgi:uridine kinase